MTRILKMRPTKRPQGRKQRLSWRTNPLTGLTWGQANWPAPPAPVLDLTVAIFGETPAPFASLATLKADATTFGDGFLAYGAGADFTAGQFVTLGDASVAHYATAAWAVGVAPA